jgi:hypothetical protein
MSITLKVEIRPTMKRFMRLKIVLYSIVEAQPCHADFFLRQDVLKRRLI